MPITRRVLLQVLASTFLLRGAPLCAAAPLTWRAGNLPAARDINRIVSAGAPADLLLLAAAPEKLVGFSSFDFSRRANIVLPDAIRRLPKYGRLAGRASTMTLEKLLALKPDVIIDCGDADPTWISQTQRINQQTRIPWLLINGALINSAQQLLTVGKTLGTETRTQPQAELAQQFIDDALRFSRSPAAAIRFYAARGPGGLETGLQGSLHTEAAELLGLQNVAQIPGRHGLAQVSLENLLAWQPDIILVQDEPTRQSLQQNPAWQGVTAVAKGRILLLDGLPFGWLDAPPGINRLLGLRRLQAWLDDAIRARFQKDMQLFSTLFWHSELSARQYKNIVPDL